MKRFLLLSWLRMAFASAAFAQTTYLVDTAFFTDIGYGGAEASCKATGATAVGFGMNRATGYWLADVFTVPTGSEWKFDTVILFGELYGSGTTSPYLDCNLEIYNAPPGLGGSVIWGDTASNVLVSSSFAGIYRVDTLPASGGITSNVRPIFNLKLHLSPAPLLAAGTYWLAWSCATTPSVNQPVCPPKVLPGRINPPGQMGRNGHYNSWAYAADNGMPMGFDKIIKASAAMASTPIVSQPSVMLLGQNVPNPFNESTSINFNLPEGGFAKLSVYNMLGQLVLTPVIGEMNAGNHNVKFNAGDLPNGTYLYKLQTGSGTECRQMAIVR